MPDYQSVYRKFYSCETVLVKITNDIMKTVRKAVRKTSKNYIGYWLNLELNSKLLALYIGVSKSSARLSKEFVNIIASM